jgi:penicillin-binding protein 1A
MAPQPKPEHRAVAQAGSAPDPEETRPVPPPVLTKRGAEVLVQVERMLDDAAKTADRPAGKTSALEPPKPVKPVSSSAASLPDNSLAAATPSDAGAPASLKN